MDDMFTYYFIDNYGINAGAEVAFDKDLPYLQSLVKKGKYRELVIIRRFF